MPIKFRVLGGMLEFSGKGGGGASASFIFMGAGIFLTKGLAHTRYLLVPNHQEQRQDIKSCLLSTSALLAANYPGCPETSFLGLTKGRFPKGWFVPPERGYIQMFPRNENQNEGTFACSPGTKTGTRARSPKPPFYETALLSPRDKLGLQRVPFWPECLHIKFQKNSLCKAIFYSKFGSET